MEITITVMVTVAKVVVVTWKTVTTVGMSDTDMVVTWKTGTTVGMLDTADIMMIWDMVTVVIWDMDTALIWDMDTDTKDTGMAMGITLVTTDTATTNTLIMLKFLMAIRTFRTLIQNLSPVLPALAVRVALHHEAKAKAKQ